MATAVPNDVCYVPGGKDTVTFGDELDAALWVGGYLWEGEGLATKRA